MIRIETVVNGDSTRVVLIPSDQRDKNINRLAFDGNLVATMDLREDGALVFVLKPKPVFVASVDNIEQFEKEWNAADRKPKESLL